MNTQPVNVTEMLSGEIPAPAATDNAAASIQLADYELQHKLGSGGYGEVWRAIGPGGLPKAVKILYGARTGEHAESEMKALERMRDRFAVAELRGQALHELHGDEGGVALDREDALLRRVELHREEARLPLLESMPPFLGGGDMIESVSFDGTTFAPVPQKFEAGTPDIASVIGFGAAVDYLSDLGMEAIATHEHELLVYATDRLRDVPGLRIIGNAKEKASVISFVLDDAHPHDIGTVLDGEGVAVRAGHHCAQPLMQRMGVPATARASLAFYNTREDVDRLVDALRKTVELFR